MSQVIYTLGEHMGPYAGYLGDKADLTSRAAILAPTAVGKQFSSDFTTVIPKGPRLETPHKHMVGTACSASCLEQVTHSKPQTRSMVRWLFQVRLGLLRGLLTKALLHKYIYIYISNIEAKLTL